MSFEKPNLENRETKAHGKAREIAFPRKEYASGEKKLSFEYKFPTGEVLRATENEKGEASIVIEKEGEVIVNFQDFAPQDQFITPSYFLDKPYIKQAPGMWKVRMNRIEIGDMQDPKSILALLHELGHTRLTGNEDYFRAEWEASTKLFSGYGKEQRMQLAEKISEFERKATAEALRIVREVEKEKGIDLLAGFENFDEVQEYNYAALRSYRLGVGEKLLLSDKGLLQFTWRILKEKMGGEQADVEYKEFLEKLFDKRRLQRKPFSKQ